MTFYGFLSRILHLSYAGKIMVVSFVGVHVPMIGAVTYMAAADGSGIWADLDVIGAMLVATLAGTVATLAALWAMLAPVRAAGRAMQDYLKDRTVPALPVKYRDDAGRLMANVQEGVTRLDAALDAANSRADAGEGARQKLQLLSEMGHELRTPLTHILGFSEMIASEALGPVGQPVYKGYATDIGRSGGQLADLLHTILSLSEAESAAAPANDVIPSSLRDGVLQIVRLHHLAFQQAQVRVTMDVADNGVAVDTRTLKQILLNGVQALLPSIPAQGQLTLSSARLGDTIRLILEADGGEWKLDDLPPERRGDIAGLKAYDGSDTVAFSSASPAALRLALAGSLLTVSGGTLRAGAEPGLRRLILTLPVVTAPALRVA